LCIATSSENEPPSHKVINDALWAVQALLKQAEAACDAVELRRGVAAAGGADHVTSAAIQQAAETAIDFTKLKDAFLGLGKAIGEVHKYDPVAGATACCAVLTQFGFKKLTEAQPAQYATRSTRRSWPPSRRRRRRSRRPAILPSEATVASIRKRESAAGVSYHVQVRPKGFPPETASFERLTDAKAWAQPRDLAGDSTRCGVK
jgi:hypothetical protein